MPWAHGVAMGSRFTRRRFLTALGAGAAYLALTNTVGCELLERTSKLTSLRLPRVGPAHPESLAAAKRLIPA